MSFVAVAIAVTIALAVAVAVAVAATSAAAAAGVAYAVRFIPSLKYHQHTICNAMKGKHFALIWEDKITVTAPGLLLGTELGQKACHVHYGKITYNKHSIRIRRSHCLANASRRDHAYKVA
uniref:Uncharacterized protein n=1 Tax=Glossina palpalis gambiensis TaxID=67801 RepID=A0A1B0B1M8_9MUSC